jgi:hypothetical protein
MRAVWLVGIFAALVGWAGGSTTAVFQPAGGQLNCTPQAPAINVKAVPVDVICNDAAVFSDYSWRAFLALTRRANPSKRGEFEAAATVSNAAAPRVFETFKAHWELFRAVPDPWPTISKASPCANLKVRPGDLVLASFNKLDDLMQLAGPSVSGPLVAQNRTYVRYGVGYNRTAYEAIVRNQWHLTKGLGAYGSKPVMPNGSIVTKSAWMIVTASTTRRQKYYRRQAWVRRVAAGSNTCEEAEVALIALHVVQKTAMSPQWIWTTFEHVDNVPMRAGEPQRSKPFALHDDDLPAVEMPPDNPLRNQPLIPNPPAMNVVSNLPLSSQTLAANAAYRAALSASGAIWQHYQLVMTQWPKDLGQPGQRGDPSLSIPGGKSAFTAYANPALETYFQTPIENGCMSCHNSVRDLSDFLWSPVLLARDEGADESSRSKRDDAMRALLQRLKSGGR